MIEEIFDYYIKYGQSDYIGEDVSQISHMIQTAMLAENNNEPIHLILACLFHDIGHLLQIENDSGNMSKYGVKNHEKITKKFLLDNNIPEPIPSLAENHVKAKKYKTFNSKFSKPVRYIGSLLGHGNYIAAQNETIIKQIVINE